MLLTWKECPSDIYSLPACESVHDIIIMGSTEELDSEGNISELGMKMAHVGLDRTLVQHLEKEVKTSCHSDPIMVICCASPIIHVCRI